MVTTTLCTSGMVLAKVGIGYNTNLDGKSAAIISSDFIIDLWIVEGESYVNNLTRYDWVTNYTSIAINKKKILQEIVSSFAAVYAIQYDMAGFPSRAQAEDKINILNNSITRGIAVLKEDKTLSFMGAT